jgi:chromosome partitioning protein
MYISVASLKGGVGKSTSAVHLAVYFQQSGPTLLVDGDPNRSATRWAKRGKMPFAIADEKEAAYQARNFKHVIIDTSARPEGEDLEAIAKGCDLLVIPTTPAALDTDVLVLTLAAVNRIAPSKYRVLLTKVPPPPETEGPQLREELQRQGIPMFAEWIPRLKAFERAATEGVPVNMIKHKTASRAWKAYQAVGEEIVNGRK